MTNKEAIANLNHIYGIVSPDIQRSLDVAIKALERPQAEWSQYSFHDLGAFGDWDYKCSKCNKVNGWKANFCPNCGAEMKGGAK